MTCENQFSPELAVLVAAVTGSCARGGAPAAGTGTIGWSEVADLARRHRVQGVLWQAISKGEIAPTAEVAEQLEGASRALAFQFLAQLSETARIMQSLEHAGIPAISLKGCALALDLYAPRAELRHSVDIDVLVAPADYAAAQDVLRREGYIRQTPAEEMPAAAESMARYLLNASEFERPHDRMKIELHHRLLDPYLFKVSFAELLARAGRVTVADTSVRTLGDDDQAVYLCAHAALHAFFRLKWLADLVLLFDRIGDDGIGRALARAREVGCAKHVELSLLMCERLAGRHYPVLTDAVRLSFGRLARQATAAIVADARASRRFTLRDLPADFRELLYVLRLAPGWPSRRFKLLWHLSNHKDLSVLRLGAEWAVLYALLGRPLALARWVGRIGTRRGDSA